MEHVCTLDDTRREQRISHPLRSTIIAVSEQKRLGLERSIWALSLNGSVGVIDGSLVRKRKKKYISIAYNKKGKGRLVSSSSIENNLEACLPPRHRSRLFRL